MIRIVLSTAVAVLMLGAFVSVSGANHATTELVSTGDAGGNGAFTPTFRGASADGTRVFFETNEPLEAGDTDTKNDIYERFGSTTTRISTGPSGGNGAFGAFFAGASADGTRVLFSTNESLEASDTDGRGDIYERFGSTTTRISTGPSGGNGAYYVFYKGASADGTRVFFETNEPLDPGDTDTRYDIYERSGSTTTRISTGSSGGNVNVNPHFNAVSADGTRVFFTTTEALEAGDTDSRTDVYERFGSTTTRISTGPSGGNGALGAGFLGLSIDGTRVFVYTNEPLDAGDTDMQYDIYERAGATTTRISTGPSGGNGAFDAVFRGVSADGTRVFFSTNESLELADTDPFPDIYERSGPTTTRISTGPTGGNGNFHARFVGASADGTPVFFETNERLEAGDTDSQNDIYERFGSTTTRISTGSSGGNGAFDAVFRGVSADGTRVFFSTNESLEAGDTDATSDAYEHFGSTTTLLPGYSSASVDGTRVFFSTSEPLLAADTDSSPDIYAAGLADTAGYPRPQGATPIRVSLVPAYEECASPNVGHAAPFAFEACNPPDLSSDHLTVGTPDANGAPAKSNGFAEIKVLAGVPGGADDSDASLKVSMSDVRNQGSVTDYTGELRLSTGLRITDTANGPSEMLPGTVVDLPLEVTVPCSATGDTTIGGSCSITTSLDTLLGASAMREGKRAIYDTTGEVDLFDGGADGDVDTPAGDTLFATDGFFVP